MIFQYLSVALVLAASSSSVVNAQGHIKPWESIGSALADADSKATFTISASSMEFGLDAILSPDVEASIEESLFTFDVVVANPAVTPDTIMKDEEGNLVRMGELAYSLLIPSVSDQDDGTVALISVDHKTGVANGVVQKKDSDAMHIHQKSGRSITAEKEPEFEPPEWACTVADEHSDEPIRHRRLTENHHDHQDHDHEGHDHHHHHHHNDHGLDAPDLSTAVENLSKSLRGSDITRKRRKLQNNEDYSYWLDIHVEVDTQFVNNNGGTIESASNYVNALFTLANSIYEKE